MKNKILLALCVSALFITPMVSSAYITDANMIEELKSQIASLLKQVQELQAKLASQTGSGSSGSAKFCHTFNTDLKIGDQGDDVASLLTVLVMNGIATERSSNYASMFDETLASHVSAFQEKYRSEILTPAGLSNATGYLGARTRAKLNSLYGCGNTQPVACTMEARACPDGSYVGRTGPKCEFATCPSTTTPTPSLNVTSPNGGETWYLGNLNVISWKPAQNPSVSPISVSLVDSYGNERFIGTTKNTVNQDYYAWPIPNCTAANPCSSNFQIAPGKYKIRITSPTSKDESDGYFTIAGPTTGVPSVTVMSPNGGEKFTQGSIMPVWWKNTNYRNSVVNVYLYRGNHSGDYNYVARIGDVAQTNDEGVDTWVIPSSVPAGDNYFIRVNLDVKDPEAGYDMNDDSDRPFSIAAASQNTPTITINSPKAGEQWRTGETKEIKWQSTNAPTGAWVGRVSLYNNNGATFLMDLVPFLSQSSVNASTYYQVPANSVTGNDFKVQVILYTGTPGNESVVASDWSDTFSISSSEPTIALLSPNGGEEFIRGKMQSYPIKWYDTGYYSVGNEEIVLMECSLSPCAEIGVIAYHTPGTTAGETTYYWDASTLFSLPNGGLGQIVDNGKYKILIRSTGGKVSDMSDSTFTIK